MGLVADWSRGIVRAGGVALLLPLALALGIGLTAALGGGDRLRALGQLVEGPSAPVAGARVEPDLAATARVPALELARVPASSVVGRTSPAAGRRGGTTAPRRRSRRPSPPPSRTRPSPGTSTPQAPAAPSQPSGGGGSPSTPSAPPANPVREVGEQAAGTVKKLPAPAGPVAGDTVQTVVDLITPPQAAAGQGNSTEPPHPPQWSPSPTHSPPQPPGASPTSSRG